MRLRFTAAALLALVAGGALAYAQEQIYKPGGDVGYPSLLRQEQPKYSDAARLAGLQGTVEVEAVVKSDGTVGDVKVVKSLDSALGLDDAAVAATKHWLFKPAMKGGVPVATYVTIILEFRLSNPSQVAASDAEFSKGAYAADTPGLVKPKLTKTIEPKYTSQALRAKIAGTVIVEAVVLPDGTVGRARVSQSLDPVYGLDAEAVTAALQDEFEPGQLNGQPVPVLVKLTLEFRIH